MQIQTKELAKERLDLRRIGDASRLLVSARLVARTERRARRSARRFAGDPVVLFRGKSGQVFALEDRCAHRQVPLSLGIVDGETLKCGYHGWTYDCAGKCIDVPYLGRERLPNGVRSYPAREVDGLIFIFPGNAALAEERGCRRARLEGQCALQDAPAQSRRSPATTPSCTRTCST